MSEGRDEVEAAVDAIVHYVATVQSTFVAKKPFKLVVNVLDDGAKAAAQEFV